MKKAILFLTFLAACLVAEELPGTPWLATTGDVRALVIVAEFPDDSADYGEGYYPPFYDSLIAPTFVQRTDSMYKWGLTNFLATASWDSLRVYGDVNPTFDSHYVIAPHSVLYYDSCFPDSSFKKLECLETDLVSVMDNNGVDFSLYDNRGSNGNYIPDGFVDFVFFILPRHPLIFIDKDSSDGWWADHAVTGYSGDGGGALEPEIMTNDGVKIDRRCHISSTHSYYIENDTVTPINQTDLMNLMAHELGHSFENGNATQSFRFFLRNGLPDRYEEHHQNPYANSAVAGKYTAMQLRHFIPHTHLYTPWERTELDWIEPTVIDTNSQQVRLRDFNVKPNTSDDWKCMLYKIPVDSEYVDTGLIYGFFNEYFLLANYQPSSHWLDDLGESYPEEFADHTPNDSAHGLLIWHMNERFWDERYQNTELAKCEDLECAEGLMNLYGDDSSPFGTEAGWDRLDRWCFFNEYFAMNWNPQHNASSSSPLDFFNPDYKNAFHTLTNPSSDAYNTRTASTYTYPGGAFESETYGSVTEQMYLQNLPTHVSIEGIHYASGTDIELCIRRSRIWTDQELAMDRTTQRKFICDADDSFHFIYPLKGHIYYTKTYDPSKIWFKAEHVGPNPIFYDSIGYGVWPAMTLDYRNLPISVFYDTSCSKVLYNYKDTIYSPTAGLDTLWLAEPDTLGLIGDPGPVAIDYGFGEGVVTNPGRAPVSQVLTAGLEEGTVHLAYITKISDHYALHYTHFPKTHPEDAYDNIEEIEADLALGDGRELGASLEVDMANDKIYVAYGCFKDTLTFGDTIPACYYREKVDTFGWTPVYLFAEGASTTAGEPMVPFVDLLNGQTRVVFNANDRIYANFKNADTAYNQWPLNCEQLYLDRKHNRYPQVANNTVTWTNGEGTDRHVLGLNWPVPDTFLVDSAYYGGSNYSYLCHVTNTSSGPAYLYQHAPFTGPKWAIYYRDPSGFGGNQESDGSGQPLIPATPEFSMSVSKNILTGNQFSVFTTASCELVVYDATGRRVTRLDVDSKKVGEVETSIDCERWSRGVYFVRAIPREGKVVTSKVVLVR